jgi:hypothetical protein
MSHADIAPYNKFKTVLAGSLALVGGCASIPDVTVDYRPVKWSVAVAVAHTVTCSPTAQQAVVERGATVVPIYGADKADPRYRLRLKDLDRYFADADITFVLSEDGRLKSINQTTTGQGEAVVKSTVGAVATFAASRTGAASPAGAGEVQLFSNNRFDKAAPTARFTDVCGVVRRWSLAARDKLPQISLTQYVILKATTAGLALKPSQDQAPLFDELKKAGLDLSTSVVAALGTEELQPIVKPSTSVNNGEVPITLQQMRSFNVKVTDQQGEVGSKSVAVPLADPLAVPIPKAALFGKQGFSLVLAESGKITSMGYARTTGVPGALNAFSSISGKGTTEDAADAAALDAAADLIYQQQRLNNCRLKPEDCKP